MPKAPRKKVRLSEIEAAIAVGMSPELLKWFTTHAPKQGDPRKLAFTTEAGECLYDKDELLAFDRFLREPWPHKNGQRPSTPSAIREEIKLEGFCECAVCHNANDGEVAHIEPVATTFCNHPENLLWLCPSHHTAYDFGHHVHATLDLATVKFIKRTLRQSKLRRWQIEHKASRPVLLLVKEVEQLRATIQVLVSPELKEAFERHAKRFLHMVHSRATEVSAEFAGAGIADGQELAVAKEYRAFAKAVAASTDDVDAAIGDAVDDAMNAVVDARKMYLKNSATVDCPVCRGDGSIGSHGGACPACGGEGTMSARQASTLDTSQYDLVKCPLCEGACSFREYDSCPECGGEGEVEQRYLARIDVARYDLVTCPLCEGRGSFGDYDTCPECGGEEKVERHCLETIDVSAYDKVECPACDGKGAFGEYDNCPECAGEGKVEHRHLERVDLSKYERVECPLCEGGAFRDYETCPECGGEGEVEQGDLQRIDLSKYDMVKCPLCKGRRSYRGEDCLPCQAQGVVERRQIENIDLSEYR